MRFSASHLVLMLTALAVLAAAPAQAISEKNRVALAKHFAELGPVKHELYAPLGGPEVGAAVIEGTSPRMEVVLVNGKEFKTLLTLGVPAVTEQSPFTFLLTGMHLLTYPTVDWTDSAGPVHHRGDLAIYDLSAKDQPKKLFELQDVLDLTFAAAGSLTPEGLLWQPSRHFLNTGEILPVKNNYFRLALNQETGEYQLYMHLTALPDAATVDSANINNRALLYYNEGRLFEASRLLEQAAQLAESNQSVVLRNQALINSELDDLDAQGNLLPDKPFDEGLAYYWEGDYGACLRVMENRQNFSDTQLAMLGLALAQVKRWPEVDRTTVELERRKVPFLADYLSELVKIARFERFDEIANVYLLALQVTDKDCPGYAANLAAMYVLSGDTARAEQLLEDYLSKHAASERNLSEPRLTLFTLYHQRANQAGCEQLLKDAQAGMQSDLNGLVQLLDFVDYSAAMTDVPLAPSDRIKAPKKPLEGFGQPEQPPIDPEEGVHELGPGEGDQ